MVATDFFQMELTLTLPEGLLSTDNITAGERERQVGHKLGSSLLKREENVQLSVTDSWLGKYDSNSLEPTQKVMTH